MDNKITKSLIAAMLTVTFASNTSIAMVPDRDLNGKAENLTTFEECPGSLLIAAGELTAESFEANCRPEINTICILPDVTITDEGAESLAQALKSRISQLDFLVCTLGGTVNTHIQNIIVNAIKTSESIDSVSWSCVLSDSASESDVLNGMIELLGSRNLKELTLCDALLTDEAARTKFSNALRNTTLSSLTLLNANIREEERKILQEAANPNLKLTFKSSTTFGSPSEIH